MSSKRVLAPEYAGEDFLLTNAAARDLYHEFARDLPIIDFHCHLSPALIAENHKFRNIAELWLAGDHYKWRCMRACGVPERYITGDAPDWEKFREFARITPELLRNPIYEWIHMELRRPFGIADRLLDETTAKSIWDETGEMLQRPEFSARGIMQQFSVEIVCTTDDPADDLGHHRTIQSDRTFPILVVPTFRPDQALNVHQADRFPKWVDRLAAAADTDIHNFDSLMRALRKRAEYFASLGCRSSDQGMEEPYADDYTELEVNEAFASARAGVPIDEEAARKLRSAVLHELGLMYHELGWAMQLHLGPIRNNSSRQFMAVGPDAGFDSMSDRPMANALSRFFDRLDRDNGLTRTVVYNLNPADNEMIASMIGNFQGGGTRGKMQFGSAWWFMDQREGIQRQLNAISHLGVLSCFIGMLTDSRSFVSYVRHDYFRRILCDLLGEEMQKGLLPNDLGLVGAVVRRVCYENAKEYFQFGKEARS